MCELWGTLLSFQSSEEYMEKIVENKLERNIEDKIGEDQAGQ